MKKILVIAGVAFLVSLAAGAGGRMMLAPSRPAGDEAVEAGPDGSAIPPHGEAASPPAAHAAEAAAAAHTGEAGQPGGEGVRPASAVHPDDSLEGGAEAADATTDGPPGAPSRRPIEFREMGLILASMQPEEAGLFLSYLDDQRASGLLRAMTVAEAANILEHVSDERSKRLRRLLLAELGEEQ